MASPTRGILTGLRLKAMAAEPWRYPRWSIVMNRPQQTDEEIPTYDVSDEALEAAGAAMAGGAVTLIQGSYCFTCAQEAPCSPLSSLL